MRIGTAAGTFLLFGCVLAGAGAARADDSCVNPTRAVEKMNGNYGTVELLSQAEVEGLGKAYAAANGGRQMAAADAALVFHRPDNPLIAWVILFAKGCAIGQDPMEEATVRKGLAQAAPADSKSEAAPKADPGAAK